MKCPNCKVIGFLFVALFPFVAPAFADADQTATQNELVLIGGVADLRKDNRLPFGVVQARFAPDFHGIRPYANVGWESRGSVYVAGGAYYNFELQRRCRITLGFGPGYYRHRGSASNLGYAVEFYSWIEFSSVIFDKRVGLSVGHLSNAHLGAHNPGTEDVSLSVGVLSW